MSCEISCTIQVHDQVYKIWMKRFKW